MAMARCKAPGTARESAQARMGPARGSAQRGRLLLFVHLLDVVHYGRNLGFDRRVLLGHL